MPLLSNLFHYYRDCYLHDFKAISVNNFFKSSIDHQLQLDTFEPFIGKLDQFPINSEWGQQVDEALLLHSKEKSLYAGVFFIKGKAKVLGRPVSIFAPLYLYEVQLYLKDDVYFIELDLFDPIINPAFLEYLKFTEKGSEVSYDQLVDALPGGAFDFVALLSLKKQLHKLFPDLNTDGLEGLLEDNQLNLNLKKIHKSNATQYRETLISGVMLGLADKPKGARGVINELTTMGEEGMSTAVLKQVFLQKKYLAPTLKTRQVYVPVSLSEGQKNVFYSVDQHPITLVIGPPGTGKSFTIAALTTELISNGKSVLIASKNNQAGKVIATKIEKDFGLKGVVIKTASQRFKNSLKIRLHHILNGIGTRRNKGPSLTQQEYQIKNLNRNTNKMIDILQEKEKEEIKWGQFFYNYKNSFFNRYKTKWITYKKSSGVPVWKLKKDIEVNEKNKNLKIKRFIRNKYDEKLYGTLTTKRNHFVGLINALEEETGNLIHEQFARLDFSLILKALPAWIVNTTDVHNILPLKKEIFDVLIIDEATQCDLASTIPLIYRAKKIVIVGDPNQLRHISFLSNFQQNFLKQKYNLIGQLPSYRKDSILDVVNRSIQSQDQVVLLDEHYRSKPDIIAFSNRKFYENNLKIMTASPVSLSTQNVVIREVDGERNEKGENKLEAEMLLAEIKKIVEAESSLPKNLCNSIGAISPFRAQVSLIQSLVRKNIELAEIRRHNILIGTPYHFQGEERDMVLISFVVDNQTHGGTYNYLNKKDVFNVSITRARNRQMLFTSFDYKNNKPNHLISQYLNSVGQLSNTRNEANEEYDEFTREVIAKIENWEVSEIFQSVPVAGVEIDIVVINNNKTYCIDLIGYPGKYEAQFTIENISMLNRMNHSVFFLPYSNWYLEKDRCEKELRKFLTIE